MLFIFCRHEGSVSSACNHKFVNKVWHLCERKSSFRVFRKDSSPNSSYTRTGFKESHVKDSLGRLYLGSTMATR